jgi:hypothetical protein
MYARCRDCDEQIPASAPSCPVCLRERSREEIFEALSGNDPKKTQQRRGTLSAVFWLLLAGGVVYGGVRYNNDVLAKKKVEEARLKAAADAERDRWESDGSEAEKAEGFGESINFSQNPVGGPRRERLPERSAPLPGSEAERRERERERRDREIEYEARKGDDAWTVTGEVYDLVSLKPVSGLRLRFTPKGGGESVDGRTNSKGRYRVVLPKDGTAYVLRLRHRAYSGAYVEEESGIPFKNQSRSRRLEHYQSFLQAPLLHVPLSPPASIDAVTHSFVMLPN